MKTINGLEIQNVLFNEHIRDCPGIILIDVDRNKAWVEDLRSKKNNQLKQKYSFSQGNIWQQRFLLVFSTCLIT